jgi:hypothetical protein
MSSVRSNQTRNIEKVRFDRTNSVEFDSVRYSRKVLEQLLYFLELHCTPYYDILIQKRLALQLKKNL